MTIDVVMCGDKNVILGMAVGGRSALEHASETVNFWVICQDYSATDKDNLRKSWAHFRLGTITFKDIAHEKVKDFRSTGYLKSKVAYARYFAADFFPDVSRCVYLDTDLLVLRDLSELMHMDLGTNAIAASIDIAVRVGTVRKDFEERLGIKDYLTYFNSGLLLLDLDYWRANDITNKIIQVTIDKRDVLHSQDQDALNIIFEDKTTILDVSWNTSQYEKPDPIEGNIIHLLGTIKPWHARYQPKFVEVYYRDVIYACFCDILDRTAYQGRRPWNPLRLGEAYEFVEAKLPTADMIARKIRLQFDRRKRM